MTVQIDNTKPFLIKLMDVIVRDATADDAEFLRGLFFEIRAPDFLIAGLVGESLDQLLNQQDNAMRTYYDQVYAEALYEILEVNGQPIGYQATIDIDTLHLIDIAITSDFRGKGIGTKQMIDIQTRAKALDKALTLTVEKFNPALRLYQRLGFQTYQETDIYLRMRWEPT